MDTIEDVISEKCGVHKEALIPSECEHTQQVVVPKWLRSLRETATGAAKQAEAIYKKEILNQEVEQEEDFEKVNEACKTMPDMWCRECLEERGRGSVVVLPGWIPMCRIHAEKLILRSDPLKDYLVVSPNGEHSTVWCMRCKKTVSWGTHLPSLQYYPPKDDALDNDAGKCMAVATSAAEALGWHTLRGDTMKPFLEGVRGVFLLPTGLDPKGVDSEWSRELYKGMLTEFGCLPSAAVLTKKDEYDAICLEKPCEEGKCLLGFLLTPDDEPEEGEEAVDLADKLRSMQAIVPGIQLSPRQVWNSVDEFWVTAMVPHLPEAEGDVPSENKDSYAPLEDVKMHKDIDASSETDDEEEASGESPPTKEQAGWIQFFMTAYAMALGIIQIGEEMEMQEEIRG
eukprot:TRINITY_DN3334_c0_g1_i1.p1 TRINITY_DN3334_c0_g1~~TRINITY_DN3334_c0_g1_i1.p1  ORF type:complete len:398 (+),score=83.90 TRINITY_DN3334_c0_g1_i1:33-1226(+)